MLNRQRKQGGINYLEKAADRVPDTQTTSERLLSLSAS